MELKNAEQRLLNEVAGIFSPETVVECVHDSATPNGSSGV